LWLTKNTLIVVSQSVPPDKISVVASDPVVLSLAHNLGGSAIADYKRGFNYAMRVGLRRPDHSPRRPNGSTKPPSSR
jgi:hypothetical protein